MARKAVIKKENSPDKKILRWKDLVIGKCYIGVHSNTELYYFFMSRDTSYLPYIYSNKYYDGGDMKSSFTIYHEVDEYVEEHMRKCMEKKKATKIPEIGKYMITLGTVQYNAAIEERGKIVWSEEIEPILHLVKEELPIKTTGYSTKRPKTLKDLKKLIT